MKIIIDKKGNWNLWESGDFKSLFGVLSEKDILKGGRVKSHIGKEFLVFDAKFVDKFLKLKRGPAVMTKKDIGIVLAYTGVNSKFKIVEAGSGCGFMTSYLARLSDNVVSYERNKDFFNITKKNLEFLGLKAELKNKDIYSGIEEKNLDLVFLDLLEPWKVIDFAYSSLVSGGFFVCYVTNVNQVQELIRSNSNIENKRFSEHPNQDSGGFVVEKIVECLEREWFVDKIKARPKSQMLGHTAFLVFMRKC